MKKVLISVMCALVCLCMAVSVFAADAGTEGEFTGKSGSQDVNITIGGDIVHSYLVDIEFTTPVFEYSSGSLWDPENYVYVPNSEATWKGEGTVKITNHSDLKVDYTVESENVVSTYGPLQINVTDGTGTIEKCSVGDVKGSHFATAKFAVNGTPTVAEISSQKLGEIKVTISK